MTAWRSPITSCVARTSTPTRLRSGINASSTSVYYDDLHGASVAIAKRLESEADANGILTSDAVRQAVAGKDVEFEDRGQLDLKGLDEPVRAWAARWDQQPCWE